MRSGSAGEPAMWYTSQPEKSGPCTLHFSRLPSEARMNAPFLVPTRTLIFIGGYSNITRCGIAIMRGHGQEEPEPWYNLPHGPRRRRFREAVRRVARRRGEDLRGRRPREGGD